MWYISVQGDKIKCIYKCFTLEPSFSVERRLSTCNELLTIQKQFIPEFLSIPLQYSLKCKVTVS